MICPNYVWATVNANLKKSLLKLQGTYQSYLHIKTEDMSVAVNQLCFSRCSLGAHDLFKRIYSAPNKCKVLCVFGDCKGITRCSEGVFIWVSLQPPPPPPIYLQSNAQCKCSSATIIIRVSELTFLIFEKGNIQDQLKWFILTSIYKNRNRQTKTLTIPDNLDVNMSNWRSLKVHLCIWVEQNLILSWIPVGRDAQFPCKINCRNQFRGNRWLNANYGPPGFQITPCSSGWYIRWLPKLNRM